MLVLTLLIFQEIQLWGGRLLTHHCWEDLWPPALFSALRIMTSRPGEAHIHLKSAKSLLGYRERDLSIRRRLGELGWICTIALDSLLSFCLLSYLPCVLTVSYASPRLSQLKTRPESVDCCRNKYTCMLAFFKVHLVPRWREEVLTQLMDPNCSKPPENGGRRLPS